MDKDTKISSSRLFHYTNTIENLLGILRNGFKIKYSLEKLNLFDTTEKELTDEFAIPMICFCDLPLTLVENHMLVYGKYSIGLKKEWGEKQAICPIIYLPKESETRYVFEQLVRNYNKNHSDPERVTKSLKDPKLAYHILEIINLFDGIIDLIMYIKPYIGLYERKRISFKDENYKFYDEREWRYKPSKLLVRKSFMTKAEYLSYNSEEERNMNLKSIGFEKEDIVDIIVPENEIEIVRNELKKIEGLKDLDPKIVNTIENKTKK